MIAREGVLAPEFSSIEAWLGRPGKTWDYYRQLEALGATYRPDLDTSAWLRFNLTAYHQQAQTVRFRLQRADRLRSRLSDFAENAGLDPRTVSAVYEAAAGRVRRARYEHDEDLSLQQAQRDLRDLVAAGILAPVGRTRARFYQAGPRLPGGGARDRGRARHARRSLRGARPVPRPRGDPAVRRAVRRPRSC